MFLIIASDSVGVERFGNDVFFCFRFFLDFVEDVFELVDGFLDFADVLGSVGSRGEFDGKGFGWFFLFGSEDEFF